MGSYAGKKQVLRGTLDFMTGENLSQPAGMSSSLARVTDNL